MDGMRVRVRLDQQRIASLLQGITPQAMGSQFADVASGVLSMLGDMAALSFARYHPGQSPPVTAYALVCTFSCISCTVTSLCNDCIGKNCPYVELSLPRGATALRMQ